MLLFAITFWTLAVSDLSNLLVLHVGMTGIVTLLFSRKIEPEEDMFWLTSMVTNMLATGFLFLNPILLIVVSWELLPSVIAGQADWSNTIPGLLILFTLSLFPIVLLIRTIRSERKWGQVEEDELVDTFDYDADFDDDKLSRENPANEFSSTVLKALTLAITISAVIGSMGVGATYFYLLRNSIAQNRHYSWENIQAIVEKVSPDLFQNILVYGGVYLGVFAAWGVIKGAVQLWTVSTNQNAQRPLSYHEEEYISQAHTALQDYIESLVSKTSVSMFSTLIIVFFVGGILGGSIGLVWLDQVIIETLGFTRTQQFEWALYLDDMGIAAVISIFALILVLGLTISFFSKLFPQLERAYVLSESTYGGGDEQAEAGFPAFRLIIAKFVRYKKVDISGEFHPAHFLNLAFHRFDPWLLGPAVILLVLSFGFGVLDRRDYDLITEDFLETSDYWSGERKKFSWNEIESVFIRCSLDKDGDLTMKYKLILPEESIQLLNVGSIAKYIDRLERVDSAVRQSDTTIKHTYKSDAGETKSRYEAGCEQKIANRFDEPLRSRVRFLLHLDDIRAREGLEPLAQN